MKTKQAFTAAVLVLCLSCTDNSGQKMIERSESAKVRNNRVDLKPDYAVKTPEYLSQNWDHATRMQWWYTSQGSHLIPYAWFMALEQPNNAQLINAPVYWETLRFVTWPADSHWNPDGLPIGLVVDKDTSGKKYLGVTCAACHTSKVAYHGKEAIIEGGPAHHDFDRFMTDIAFALQNTLANPDKYARFVARVLGDHPDTGVRADLKKQAEQVCVKLGRRIMLNHPSHPNGYARLDAFGNILNEVAVFSINEASNAHPVDAPVSYPMLWDTPQHDVVQWNGSAVNAGIGPEVRNVGEAVGVFGDLRLKADNKTEPAAIEFANHIQIENQRRLEGILKTLWSPVWPESILPKVDQDKAAVGKQLYAENCIGCHASIQRDDPARQIKAKLVPVTEVRTDGMTANNILSHRAKTGMLVRQPELPLATFIPNLPKFEDQTQSIKLVSYGVLGILRDGLPPVDFVKGLQPFLAATSALKNKIHEPVYKARPLNGIWASAPYLHNGSVPNLWELLQKPAQRVSKFNVGSWTIDPVKVGFTNHTEAATSEFDTQLPGNANSGHEYGTALTDEQKWALIEYIKTL